MAADGASGEGLYSWLGSKGVSKGMRLKRTLTIVLAVLLPGCNVGGDQSANENTRKEVLSSNAETSPRRIQNPFPEAAEVKLFVAMDFGSDGPIYKNTQGVRLSAKQRKKFEGALKIEPAPESMDACFIPHHFFRYFSADGTQVGEVEVCFCCEGTLARGSQFLEAPNGEILGADYPEVAKIVEVLGEPTQIGCE